MMRIPIVDLKAQYESIKTEIDQAIEEVLSNCSYILGKPVQDFEERFAHSHRARHCIAVGSGTDALHLALWASGVSVGDEVITVPFTFIATAAAISLTGARPVFADIDTASYTLDPRQLDKVLTSRTKAVMPVHLYGQQADMKSIMQWADSKGLMVVEDAAQAHLARQDERFSGEWGKAACFSFYPAKNLGAFGEAGALLTNDDELATQVRRLRDHGQVEKYRHGRWGHNYRMDGIQGAVLGVKLNYLHAWTERRRAIASEYSRRLKNVGDVIIPTERPGACHVYHLFVIRTTQRSALQSYLLGKGISTAIHYPTPLHLQPAYQDLGYQLGDFPVSESVSGSCLALPVYPELTGEQIDYVCDQVTRFFES